MHSCEPRNGEFKSGGYGAAITCCIEDDDGYLWCDNGEYATVVNFCPFCGYMAPKQIDWKGTENA